MSEINFKKPTIFFHYRHTLHIKHQRMYFTSKEIQTPPSPSPPCLGKGFRTCFPRIWLLGIVRILSWRSLRKQRKQSHSELPPPSPLKPSCERGPTLYPEESSISSPKGLEKNPSKEASLGFPSYLRSSPVVFLPLPALPGTQQKSPQCVPSGPHLLMRLPCHLKLLVDESARFSPVNLSLSVSRSDPARSMLRGLRKPFPSPTLVCFWFWSRCGDRNYLIFLIALHISVIKLHNNHKTVDNRSLPLVGRPWVVGPSVTKEEHLKGAGVLMSMAWPSGTGPLRPGLPSLPEKLDIQMFRGKLLSWNADNWLKWRAVQTCPLAVFCLFFWSEFPLAVVGKWIFSRRNFQMGYRIVFVSLPSASSGWLIRLSKKRCFPIEIQCVFSLSSPSQDSSIA